MPHDFPLYAELWQEQIDPEELAGLQAMAKNIERTARWKRLFDFSMAALFVAVTGLFLWLHPVSLPAKLGFALLLAGAAWTVWRRQEMTRAAQATAIRDPHEFFAKAIGNVRSEVNVSTVSLLFMIPTLILCFLFISAARGVDAAELLLRELRGQNLAKTVILSIIFVLCSIYFVRDNLRMREQLRRLEGMRREWDEHQPGDAG